MGTALTEDQLRLLKRSTRRIVLALDPDVAGQKAVLRGLDAARSAMDKEGELGFDARGLLRNESRLQADLRVATMPDELDPDEIVARDKAEWASLIENANPIIEHVMFMLAKGRDLNNPKVVTEIGDQVWPLIHDLSKPEEREFFTQRLARFLKVDERAFISRQAPVSRARRPRVERQDSDPRKSQASTPVSVAGSSVHNAEAHCLGVLFRRPELLYRLDRRLEEGGLARLLPEDFEYTDHQLLLTLIRQSLEQVESDQHQYVVINLTESLKGLAQELLTQAEKLNPLVDRLLEDLERTVQKIRRARANQDLTQTRFLLEEAQQNSDPRVSFYQQRAMQLAQLLHSLDQANHRLTLRRQT